jgi:metal-sulfur cluster biosynthetic enzyme
LANPESAPDTGLRDCLRAVLDPELGLNIVDLGLVYHARWSRDRIEVALTMTSRACPLSGTVIEEVREQIASAYPQISQVDIQLVWDPVWTPDLITDSGYEQLGRVRKREMI